MSKAEVTEFAKSCIQLAAYRDGSSGGCMRLVDITKDKVTKQFFNYGTFNFR
jgi:20S proteasome alpha/beta subunit